MGSIARTLMEKLLSDHRVGGGLNSRETVDIGIDQVLLRDILEPLI